MSFPERDLQSKLDEMEAQMERENTSQSQSSQESVLPEVEFNLSPRVQSWVDSGKARFATLPQAGKAAVAIGGVWLGFSIVGAVLHVVSSIVTIGFVGLLLYVGYRLFKK